MEFWGVEVKPGQTVKCEPGAEKLLHFSQASLGEAKKDKGSENALIFVKVNDQKLVLGTLSADKCAQISYDLVFEKEFELSHSSKNSSVYFCGYKTIIEEDDHPDSSDFDSEDEEAELNLQPNGKPEVKEAQTKPKPLAKPQPAKLDASPAKPKSKAPEPKKADKQKADEDNDDSEDDDDDDISNDEDMDDAGADSDDDDDDDEEDSSDEDEETPKKGGVGEKRAAGTPSKSPGQVKKAKLVSPVGSQKTAIDLVLPISVGDVSKKGSGHTATPHPSKSVAKTPVNNDKSKNQTPKSAGSVVCKSCSKSFNSDKALESHSKAKHASEK